MRTNSVTQSGHGRAEMRLGRIPELDDERVAIERRLHASALHAASAPMNQADQPQPFTVRGGHIFFDDRRNVARKKRVEVERISDGNTHGRRAVP
jgi:hypothetical protein